MQMSNKNMQDAMAIIDRIHREHGAVVTMYITSRDGKTTKLEAGAWAPISPWSGYVSAGSGLSEADLQAQAG